MIITCPSCTKHFEVNANMIPENGKLVQCGSCNHTWFYKKDEEVSIEKKIILPKKEVKGKSTLSKSLDKNVNTSQTISSDLKNIKGSEIIKYEPKFKFSVGKLLNYIIVLIISFVAVIIVLDTFKNPLSIYFPNIELVLYNLFETLKDLMLFIKDLK